MMAGVVIMVSAGSASADQCLQEAYGAGKLNCTANDIQVASIEIPDETYVIDPCTGPGDTTTFNGILHIVPTATERYDIGFYLGQDALGSTNDDCAVFVIPPGAVANEDGDSCGDVQNIGEITLPVTNVTATCGAGGIDICSTWRQNSDATDCGGTEDALPGTPSKCNCEFVPIIGPECPAECPDTDGNPCTVAFCDNITTLGECTLIPADQGTSCRASAGICDTPEVCTGTTTDCPVDSFVGTATVCRASAGVCDADENCTGVSAACPANAFDPSTQTCRASADICDTPEVCTGTTADCPVNAFVGTATVCRASAGVCDADENCTGVNAACPADAFDPSTQTCRASADICDTPEACTGTTANCPVDAFLGTATVCRASAGVCDADENCTGVNAACPANAFDPSTQTCRASADICDTPEACTGTTADCPVNAFVGTATVCRASAGVCDADENCTGVNAACPANAFDPSTQTCRTAAGICDTPEACSGTTADCPADALLGSETVCRDASNECDAAERCTGLDLTCPVDEEGTCEGICRSPGYWSTHLAVTELLLDLVGPIEVCGQTLDTTSLGTLDSTVEGLCVSVQGIDLRQLYRQLVAAALNCAVSGASADCDSLIENFSECSDLCQGIEDGVTTGQCIDELDCFNNGGTLFAGECALGTCVNDPNILCGGDFGECIVFDVTFECVPFPGNCHSADLCNEDIEFCPESDPANPNPCKRARSNQCTIDSCGP